MKPLILITNDDGIEARGIEFLAKQVAPLAEMLSKQAKTEVVHPVYSISGCTTSS